MASIRKRGENSYLLVVSRGYDYQGNRLKPAQKTVHPPLGLTAKQTQKWLNEQAVLYEQEVKHTPAQPVDRSLTLAKYIEIWLEQIAPKKLAASTLTRDRQDIRRILPALGHYKLTELNKEILTYRFKMILRENGLPVDLNVHSLRHTNASMLIAQGVDVRTVAGLLGHAQPSTTLDIYSHAFDKNKRLAGQKLSEAMGL